MLKNLPSRRLRTLFLCLILFVFGSGRALADVITVNNLGGADYTTIQDAINAATPGDVIVIETGSGTYSPTADLDLSLMNGATPGDLSITGQGVVTIDDAGGANQIYNSGSFNANLTIDGIVFDGVSINLTDVNDFYLTNCAIQNVTAGTTHAVLYDRIAGGGVSYSIGVVGTAFNTNSFPGLGIINQTDNVYNVVVDNNEFSVNVGGLYTRNVSSGEILATIIDNVVVSDGTGRCIDLVNNGSGNTEFYVSGNNVSASAYGISANFNAGTGIVRINDNNDGAGGAFIDDYTVAGIQVSVQDDALIDVEIDGNILGASGSNQVGIDYQISSNTNSHNVAKISNNEVNLTNGAAGIQLNLDDASNGGTVDITLDGNFVPGSAGASDGILLSTFNSFVADIYVANNDVDGGNSYNFDATGGGVIVFESTAVDLATVLDNESNLNTGGAIESGSVDYVSGTTVDFLATVTPPSATDLTDATITGNAPGFGSVSGEELVSAQTVAVPLGSKVGIYGAGINGEGQVEPLFNSPIGTDVAYYIQKDGNNLLSIASLSFTIQDPDENALQFNASNGDLVDLPLTGVAPTANASRTFEMWVKRDNLATSETLFAYGAVSTDNYFSLRFDAGDEVVFSSDGTTPLTSNLFVADNDWHHVAVTFDGTTVTMYLDGVAGSTTHNIPGLNTTDTNVEIGQDFGGGNNFDGAIDEFAIWDVARTPAQITTDATTGITLPNANVIAYYKSNQGDAGNDNTLITELIDENLDHGGSFYNGALVNFTLADSDYESNFVESLVPTVFAQDIYLSDQFGIEIPDGSTASTAYDTDWETQSTGYTQSKFYEIQNVGLSDLTISAVGNISITGDAEFTLNLNAGDFPLVMSPGSSYFIDVEFTPVGSVTYNATVSIGSDDPDENPYTFDVTGVGAAQAEIDLTGNGNPINSDDSPSGSTDSWFQLGINSIITKTFTIENNGSAILSSINVTSDESDFVVTGWSGIGDISAGTASITAASSETFDVVYQANNEYFYGEHRAIITITSAGDPNETTYLLNMEANSMDNSLHFEGSVDGADDRLNITPTSFNPADANDELTVEAWIQLDSYGGTNSYIVGRYDESGSTNDGEFYLAVTPAGNLEAAIIAGGVPQLLNSSSTIGTGTWTHVAMTYDNAELTIFVNGIEEDNTDITGTASSGSLRETYLGYSFNAANNYDGQIDEVRIWDIARTPFELRQHAMVQLTGSESGLVAYFNMDDGVTEGTSLENTTLSPTDLSTSGLTTAFVNFDFEGGTLADESNYVESNAFSTTGLQDIIVTNNFFNGLDQEIGDGNSTPTLDLATFMGRADNGSSIAQTYTITNDGLNDLTINSISTITGDFSYDQFPPASTVLGPGESFDVIARFTGANNGTTGDNININTDDPTVGEDDYDFNIAAYSLDDNALDFDGVDDVVNIASGEDIFNNISTADSWTFLTWLKMDDATGINGLLSEQGGGGSNSIVINNGTIEVYDGVGSLEAQSAAGIVQEGVWTHIAIASQSGGNTFFYINGVLDGAPQVNNSVSLAIAGSGLSIGDDGNASSGYFDGAIDELIFWDSGFDQDLVQFVMANTISGNEGGLMVYYRFDEGVAGAINGGVTTLVNSDDLGATYDGTLATGPGFDLGAADVNNSNWVKSYVRAADMVVRGNSAQIDIANGETGFGLSDDRDFGAVALDGAGGAVATVTFDIASIGGTDLDLLSTTSVSFGSATPDFSITAQPSQIVSSGAVNTFTIEFDPQSAGTKTVTVQVANDGDNNPYTFDIQGFGGSNPEIDIESAGGSVITDGEAASVSDDTDMGDIGIHSAVARVITINNTGGAILNISSIVSNNTDFVVSGAPTTVAALGSETFTVTYQANNDFTYTDDKAATITINSDDADEGTFEINFLVDAVDNTLEFDGADDYINIADNTSIDFDSNDPFTFEAWVYATADGTILNKIQTGPPIRGYRFSIVSQRPFLALTSDGGVNNEISLTTVETIPLNQWIHLAVSYDGGGVAAGVNFYNSGELLTNSVGIDALAGSTQAAADLRIGIRQDDTSPFDGVIDEVRIWNVERTPSEIRANAATRIVTPTGEANLMAYYDFNYGNPVGDNSATGLNITSIADFASGGGQGGDNAGTLTGTGFPAVSGSVSNFDVSTAFASTAATTPNIGIYGSINGNLIADGETAINTTLETDFETRDLTSTTTITYDIVNEGFASLTITAAGDITVSTVDPDGAAFTEDLTAITGGPGFPLTLAPGVTQSFNIDFTPATANTFSETVTINSDDPDAEGVYVFNVEGVGANIGVISDLDASDNFTFNEDQGATIIDGGTPAVISDADAPANLLGASLTVSFTNNVEVTEDELGIVDEGTGAGQIDLTTTPGNILITGTDMGTVAGGASGTDLVITFTANATLADATNILQNITYNNINSAVPVASVRTVTFIYNDGSADSNPANVDITVVAVNDLGQIANLDATDDFTFTEGSSATIIDSATPATLTDGDNPATITGSTLTVSISNNRVDAEDVLSVDTGGTITLDDPTTGDISISGTHIGTFAGGTGASDLVITFNATADMSNTETVLRNITYRNSNNNDPTGNVRTVSFVFNDGIGDGNQADVDITVNPQNDLPSISIAATADNPYLEGGSAVIIEDGATYADADLLTSNDFDGSSITIMRSGGANAFDVFTYNDDATYILNGANIERSGTPIAAFTNASGTLTIDFNTINDATLTDVNTILRNVTYSNANPTPLASVTLDLIPNDGIGAGSTANTTINIYNNDSDIIDNSTLSATLDYASHTGATVTSANGLKVGELSLRDGGGTDTDGVSTTLDAITLQFTNPTLIQEVALFNQAYTGAALSSEVSLTGVGSDEAVFTGLSGFTATDNGTFEFSVVVTFNAISGIVDNANQIDFTVISASANAAGSQFNASDAGGATPTLGVNNLVVVNATQMVLTNFAGSTDAGTTGLEDISVSLSTAFSATIEAQDANGNLDLDYDNTTPTDYDATSSALTPGNFVGTFTQNWIGGVASWSDLIYTNAETNETVTFTDNHTPPLSPVTTVLFDVSLATSDIIEDPSFNYPENIDYSLYDAGTIDDTGDDELLIARFILRDGGALPDTDGQETELTALTFNVAGWQNIDEMAIIGNGVNEIEVSPSSSTVVMDWGNSNNTDAADGATEIIEVWATFKQGIGEITDNEQIVLTITAAEDRGGRTQFIDAAAGGASTANFVHTGDNQLEVKATGFVRTAGDLTSNLGDPFVIERDPGFSLDVEARDANDNIDLDVVGATSLTFTAGSVISTVPANFTAGTLSLSNVVIDNVFSNGTFTLDNIPTLVDINTNGVPDHVDVAYSATTGGSGVDGDGDFIDDSFDESVIATGNDEDGDDIPDFYDLDVADMVYTDITIQDTTVPTVEAFTPANDDLNVVSTTTLTIEFSEDVQIGTGLIDILNVTDFSTIENIDVTNGSKVVLSSKDFTTDLVTITLDNLLPKNKTVAIRIASTAFVDFGTNNYAGITNTTDWDFFLPDNGPIITSTDPVDLEPSASTFTTIIINFDDVVNEPDLNDATTTLDRINITGDGATGSIDYNTNGQTSAEVTGYGTSTITITPASAFATAENITVTIPESVFENGNGTSIDNGGGDYVFSFTTNSDVTAPSLNGTSVPTNGATIVDSNLDTGPIDASPDPLTIEFDEDIQFDDGVLRLYANTSTSGDPNDDLLIVEFDETDPELSISNNLGVGTLSVDMSSYLPLSGGVEYFIVIGSNLIEDLNGNNFAGILDEITWAFTIDPSDDVTAPSGVALSPATTSSGVVVSTNMVITYDEPVTLGTGDIEIKLTTTTTPIYTFDVSEDIAPANGTPDVIDNGYVTLDGDQLIIDPANDLSGLNTYYVLIDNGAVTDYAGNAHVGISSPSSWNFTTAIEGSTPSLVSIDLPVDDASGISLYPTFELTMDEPVNGVSGRYVRIRETAAPGVDVLVAEANDILLVSTQGPKITIGPFTDALEDNTEYFVQIEDGGLADLSGNPTVGAIGGDPAWTFTTVMDDTAPIVSNLNAAVDANITTQSGRTFVMEFDEDVTWGTGEINLYYTSADAIAVATLDVVADLGAGVNTANEVPEDFDFGSPNYVTGTYSFTNAAASGNLLADGGVGDAVSIGFGLGDNLTTPLITNISGVSFDYRSAANTIATDFEIWYSSDGVSLDSQLGSTINYSSSTYTSFTQSITNAVDGYIIIRSTGAGAANVVVDNLTYVSDTRLSFEFDLPSGGTNYYITVDNGAITDVINEAPANYNDFAGYAANEWRFVTSDDGVDPIVNNFAPTGSINVTSQDQIVLTFNELVNPQAGNIEIRYSGDSKLAHTIPVANASAVVDNATSEVTFTYDISDEVGQELSGNTSYYIEIADLEYLDNDGASGSTGIIGGSGTWDITTTNDATAPAVIAITPSDDAVSVGTATSTIEIDFAERVTASTGSLRIQLVSNDYEIMTIPATEATIEDDTDITGITGSRVTFPIEVVGNTQYYVVLDANSFVDATGLANAGINVQNSNDGSWNFRTATSGPTPAASWFPEDNITKAVPYTGLSGRFNLTPDVDGAPSGGSGDVLYNDEVNNILYIGTETSGGIQTGDVITASSGTAASATAGTVSTPSIDIDDNLILKFEGPVFTESGNFITLTGGPSPIAIAVTDITQVSGSGTNIITIDPTDPLHVATTYTITVDAGAFTDNDSQPSPLINSWTITTNTGAVVDNDAVGVAVPYTASSMTTCLFGDVINLQEDIVIGELNVDDFRDISANDVDLILSIGSDFEFEPGVGSVSNDNVIGDVSDLQITVTATTITITYDTDVTADQLDVIRINGLQIKQISDNVSSTGEVIRDTATPGAADIYGLDASSVITMMNLDVESVTAPTQNTYTNIAFCQDIDPDDVDGLGGVDEVGDFDFTLNAATNVVWYPEDGGSPGNPDYTSPIAGIGDPLDPTFAELLGVSYTTAGTYNVYATQTNSNGCESDTFLEVSVLIRALPDAEAAAGSDLSGVCSHEDIQIGDAGNSALDASGYTFLWAGDNMGTSTADFNPSFTAPNNTSGTPFVSTDPHTYTLTLTDNNGCVSDPGITAEMIVTLDPKVEVIVESSNGGSFSETLSDPQPLLGDRATFNAGDGNLSGYTGFFVGIPGLGNTSTSSIDQHTASFTPSDAGSGVHSIEYVLQNNSTSCADTALVVISVATNITDLFDVDPVADICELDVLATLDNEATTLGTNTFVRFSHPVGGVMSGTDNVATGWTFNPALAYAQSDDGIDVIAVDDTKLIRISRVVNDGFTDFVDGTFTFIIHPQPTVAITSVGVSDVSDNFCSDDTDVTITGTVSNDGGSQALTITSYEIRQVSPSSTSFESISATNIDFDELLNHTGIYAGISASTAGEGLYEIRVSSDAADDAYGDPPGCTNTTTTQFNLYAKPNTPTIALVGGIDPVAQVAFEFCEDEIPTDFDLDLQGITGEIFEWDDDIGFGSPFSLAGDGSNAELADLGIGAPAGEQETTTIYVRRRGFESSPFVGCLSDVLTITVTIYDTQPTPELVTYTSVDDVSPSAQAQSDGSILLEFCDSDALIPLTADNSSYATTSLAGDSYFTWYYDNVGADGIPETVIPDLDADLESLTVAELANVGIVAGTPGVYSIGFTQTDFDTGAGSGSFIYNGCESAMRTIDIDINATPTDIVTADGFEVEYFTCEGSAIADITTINEAGIVYTWYGDDGDGVFEPGGDDGTAIKEGSSIDDSELTGSAINAYSNLTPGTYYFWVTRKADRNASTTFDGCESAEILIAATVFENNNDEADQPDFESNGAGVGEVGTPIVLNFCNDDLSASDTFSAISTYTDGTFSTLADGTSYSALKKFNWYTSDISGNKNALLSNAAADDGSTGEGSVITAQELFLVGKPSDDVNYFLITQTTDIIDVNGAIYTGCEGPGVLIQVNTYDIPSAPIEDKDDAAGTLEDFYYCEGSTIATLEVEGEDEDVVPQAVTFYWYQTEADALAGTNRITTTNDPTGKTILNSELTPDELDFDGGAVANLGGTPNSGDYSFWFTQTSDIGSFAGCESLPTEVTIHVLETPQAPTVNTIAASCDDIAAPVAIISNANPGDLLRWYNVSGEDPLVDTEIYESTFGDPTFDTDGFITGTTPLWTTSFYLYRVENNNIDGLGFAGCANTSEVQVDVVIYPEPDRPSTDGVESADPDIDEYEICEATDVSLTTFDVDAFEVGATINWYTSGTQTNPSGLFASNTTSVTFAQVAAVTGLDINTPGTTTIFVTQFTDGTCESFGQQIDIIIHPLATLDILYDDNVGAHSDGDAVDGTALCHDAGTFTIEGTSDKTTGPGTWSIDTGGLSDNADNTAEFDPAAAAIAAGNSIEGEPTTHNITFTFLDDDACTTSITSTITVDPLPSLQLTYQSVTGGNSNGDQIDGTFICYDEATFNIQGRQESGSANVFSNALSGTFDIFTSLADANGNVNALSTTGFTDGGTGTAQFNPAQIAADAGMTRIGVANTFYIRFDYTDGGSSCDNFTVESIIIQPQPELNIVYASDDTDVDASAVCYDDATFTIKGIQEGLDATDGTFSAQFGGLTDNDDGTATFNPTLAAQGAGVTDGTDPSTMHDITFTYSDGLTNCENSITVTIEVTKLPTLNIVVETGDDLANGFCVDTGTAGLQGQEDAADVNGGSFSLSTGVSGITDNGDGTADVLPTTAHANAGGVTEGGTQTSHTVTFTYTNSTEAAACTNSVTTDVVVNTLPGLDISSLTAGLNATALNGTYEICESEPDIALTGIADRDGAGQFFVDGNTLSTNANLEAVFSPVNEFGDQITVGDVNSDFVVSFSYDDDNGCSNNVQKTIRLYDLPVITFDIEGGCQSPDVVFDAELADEVNSPYSLGDLSYTWYYETEQGVGYDTSYVQSPAVTFIIPDATDLEEIFEARLVVETAFGCINNDDNDGLPLKDDDDDASNPQRPSDDNIRSVPVLISPSPAFVWDTVIVNQVTSFFANEVKLESSRIVTIDTDFGDGSSITTPTPATPGSDDDFPTIEHTYSSTGLYTVSMTMTTGNNCQTTIARDVNIISDIEVTPDNPYVQSFNTATFDPDEEGWYAETMKDDAIDIFDEDEGATGTAHLREFSWTWSQVDFDGDGIISNDPEKPVSSDNWIWSTLDDTGDNHYITLEDSWLYTPSFDISQLTKPMVQFNMIYDFENDKDGAVIQYSTDRGQSWTTLGTFADNATTGLEWYNFDNVGADPGQQQTTANGGAVTSVGWSGKVSEPIWTSARHKLDEIPDADRGAVQFRFAIASTDASKDGFLGFAIDDFIIQDRTKNVMIEQFVSATNDDSEEGIAMNEATISLKSDINDLLPSATTTARDEVTLAYHADFGFEDPFNEINPAGPSARAIYYNVDQVTSILDGQFGGTDASAKSGDLTWDETDLSLNSLKDPGFEIILTPDPSATDSQIKGTVEFIANQDYATGTEFRAYVAVLEDTVEVSVGVSTGTIDGFGYVMRKLLPAGSGEYVKLASELTAGDPLMFDDSDGEPTLDELSVSWNLANIRDDANLSAIVFIQNSRTKEIYQSVRIENANDFVANKNTATVTDIGDDLLEAKDFNMFPNPTDHEVFILFDHLIHEDMNWQVYDQTGRVFEVGTIQRGSEGFSLNIDHFPSGLYYMSIRGEKTKFEFKKLMVTH
ncbi:MAG: LamG-like jellyroll fold domain-containing protein [Reichenbachiella sp.]|uniref:LamG-like jellyroll fold domain-containing protein n=1 Tax=Reichenbachiella sp. TaxID=2184521 RepID=UPI003265573B